MIRSISSINSAMDTIKSNQDLKVEQVKVEFKHFYDNILSKGQDIIDALDTFNYCREKGLDKYLNEFTYGKVGNIVFSEGKLCFQFNEWRSENSGPYNWFVLTDGKEVWIQVNNINARNNVPNMISNAVYYDDGNKSRVIAPIYEYYGVERRYATHDSARPLSALKEFDRVLPVFLDKFFNAVENLGKC